MPAAFFGQPRCHVRAATDSRLVAERQVLFDAINVGWPDECRLAHKPAALGAFALKQMAPASASEKDFACASYLETLGHCLSGLDTFGTSHMGSFI